MCGFACVLLSSPNSWPFLWDFAIPRRWAGWSRPKALTMWVQFSRRGLPSGSRCHGAQQPSSKHGASWSRNQPWATVMVFFVWKSQVEPLKLEEASWKSIVSLITGVVCLPLRLDKSIVGAGSRSHCINVDKWLKWTEGGVIFGGHVQEGNALEGEKWQKTLD